MNMRIDLAAVGMLGDLRRAWVVYVVCDGMTFTAQHVGIARAARMFDTVPLIDRPVVMRVLETTVDRTAAIIRQAHHAKALNVAALMAKTAGAGVVECVDTGQRWSTAAECAEAEGIDPAALSRHLRGLTAHTAVKGKKYKRVTNNDGKIRSRKKILVAHD